jgi:hypothetical protein
MGEVFVIGLGQFGRVFAGLTVPALRSLAGGGANALNTRQAQSD